MITFDRAKYQVFGEISIAGFYFKIRINLDGMERFMVKKASFCKI